MSTRGAIHHARLNDTSAVAGTWDQGHSQGTTPGQHPGPALLTSRSNLSRAAMWRTVPGQQANEYLSELRNVTRTEGLGVVPGYQLTKALWLLKQPRSAVANVTTLWDISTSTLQCVIVDQIFALSP